MGLGDESSEWCPALQSVLPQPRGALGQDRTFSGLIFFPVKMANGCFEMRKCHRTTELQDSLGWKGP